MLSVSFLLAIIASVAVGTLLGYLYRKQVAINQVNSAESKAEKILAEAKTKQQELLLQGRDKALKIIDDAKKEEETRRKEIHYLQQRMEKREGLFDQKLIELQEKHQKIQEKANQVEQVKAEITKIKEDQLAKLERIAGLSGEEAKNIILDRAEAEAKEDVIARVKKVQSLGADEVESKVKHVMAHAMERYAMTVVSETTSSTLDLPSDEMKGRVIGKEGRNIKAIEQLTGVEILVDDTPQVITISGFSPIRRQVAKKALEKLVNDGRIHPARIEDAVEQAKKEIAIDIKKAGEEAVYDLGLTGLDPRLVQILGRLKFRTSYGQNVLLHSLEVAYLAGLLAEELGANVTLAKKGGLLHDIGKAVDHEVQGTHPQIGYDILKKFNLPEEICYIAASHHEDSPKSIEAVIVKVADAMSASRPGARKETLERYMQRLGELENIATAFDGVDKAYAIQAGREIRVFVVPDAVDDLSAHKLAKNIAQNIESSLQYPGEIKVTLIREKRIIEYAK